MASIDWDQPYTFGRTGLRTAYGNWIGETNAAANDASVRAARIEQTQAAHGTALAAIREAVGAGGDAGVVDPAELVDAMAKHETFLDRLATALAPKLADVQDTRARDNNPSTGPPT